MKVKVLTNILVLLMTNQFTLGTHKTSAECDLVTVKTGIHQGLINSLK